QTSFLCVAPVIPSCRAHLNVPYGREDRANISQETGTMHFLFERKGGRTLTVLLNMNILYDKYE
ncbi:MAG: hypothetical protein WC484_07140, partial [Candidatus Omnitrophota bacterium]